MVTGEGAPEMIVELTQTLVSVSQGVVVSAGEEPEGTEPVGMEPPGIETVGMEPPGIETVGMEPPGIETETELVGAGPELRGMLGMTAVEEGRLGTELEGAGAPGKPQPVNHSKMMSSMLTLISIPVQPARKAASSARASKDRASRLSPQARMERAPRRLTESRLKMVSLRKPVMSTRRPETSSRETSTVAPRDSQSRTTAFSSTPREQLEPESQTARAVRTSTSRDEASSPLAQALRARRTLASMSTATLVSRKAARMAWAWTERTPPSPTKAPTEAPTEMALRASTPMSPMATRS
jgi:hypothetical protein